MSRRSSHRKQRPVDPTLEVVYVAESIADHDQVLSMLIGRGFLAQCLDPIPRLGWYRWLSKLHARIVVPSQQAREVKEFLDAWQSMTVSGADELERRFFRGAFRHGVPAVFIAVAIVAIAGWLGGERSDIPWPFVFPLALVAFILLQNLKRIGRFANRMRGRQ